MATIRKQLSMVLPESLIAAIKQRALSRGQSITGYITGLVQQDMAAEEVADLEASPLADRLAVLERRVRRLEQRAL